MKERIKGILIGIGISAVSLAFVFPSFAFPRTEQATLNFNDIKITIDGTEIRPTDAEGNSVEPFIIDGTTYLPLRAIANLFDIEIGWDGGTKTVMLTSPATQPSNSGSSSDSSSDSSSGYSSGDPERDARFAAYKKAVEEINNKYDDKIADLNAQKTKEYNDLFDYYMYQRYMSSYDAMVQAQKDVNAKYDPQINQAEKDRTADLDMAKIEYGFN